MEKIVTRSLSECVWHEPPNRGGLRYTFLVDSTEMASHGLSVGIIQVPVGEDLTLHHHAPQEIYVVRSGKGVLLKADGASEPVRADSVVYIPQNEKHGLRNTGSVPLEVLWIFPTDCWKEIEYIRE